MCKRECSDFEKAIGTGIGKPCTSVCSNGPAPRDERENPPKKFENPLHPGYHRVRRWYRDHPPNAMRCSY